MQKSYKDIRKCPNCSNKFDKQYKLQLYCKTCQHKGITGNGSKTLEIERKLFEDSVIW